MEHEQTRETSIRKGPIIASLLLGAFVAILNQTLMNVALPQMMNDLKISANTAQWLTTAYMLTNGVLIPVTAFLIEKFSTRKLFLTAMILFAAGTLLCGLAPGFELLLVGRIVQASGAGIIMPLMMTVFFTIFPVEKRGAAMGMVGMAMVFAPAIGPTLSGWIVQNYSWRVLFFIVLPVAILDLVLASLMLKNVTKLTNPKVDVISIILSTLGFGGFLYGFSSAGGKGWDSWEVMLSLFTGAAALLIFILRQLRSKTPMLEFRIFRYNMFALTTLINMIITMAMFAGMILVPIYLQNIRGFTPLESGLLLLPGAILMGIMSPITGKIFDKIGARWLAVVGLSITVVTTWGFSQLTDATTYMHMIILYSARMFGMSMLMMPIMTAGLNQLPQKWNPHGTAMSNTLRMVSGSLGTAFLVTVMANQTKEYVKSMLADKGIPVPEGAEMTASTAKSALAQLPPELQKQISHVIKEATIQGINDAFVVATGLSVLALLLSFFIKRTAPPKEVESVADSTEVQTKTAVTSQG
ncbi:MAG TPA: DHA2 family efflux MFS transporter permease subunit [Bacillales bacterium]|nr:DHA2 family efflux MFS transporter permease subunit [Bacillales bacterium]